ncbi:LysR family transcriptional regulator [Celeribacter neptunius]|uniref:DNA-binding transcriptional regulator, LysR family n=1 Tax=Celeribacter neptunius TaxID=588602 RepID=A0A1I3YAI8_9RHOB|nr:LysR family transcriptional regulator [Celeribacter neptunius]SFK28835.1 DNA-binding transcriptional regulator, LysR family [Celeribacter neptunius]
MSSDNNIGRLSYSVLRSVREVILQGGVSAAAHRLGISQSAVSQNLRRFEVLTGIPVFSHKNGTTSAQLLRVRDPIFSAVAGFDELSRISLYKDDTRRRLGVSDCIGVYLSENDHEFGALRNEYQISVASAAELAVMLEKGEVDIVFRPLFNTEKDPILSVKGSLQWINLGTELVQSRKVSREEDSVKVLSRSTSCPFSFYIDKQLRGSGENYEIVSRVDDFLVAMRLAQTNGWQIPAPSFLASTFGARKSNAQWLNEFEEEVRFGILFDEKRITLSDAMKLNDRMERIVA